jgi:hypothetical protein
VRVFLLKNFFPENFFQAGRYMAIYPANRLFSPRAGLFSEKARFEKFFTEKFCSGV